MSDIDDTDERERAEAEALAHALEAGGAHGEPVPEDALEAAALLRYGARDSELRPERAEAVLAALMPRVTAAGRATNAPRRLVRFASVAAGALAAAALVALAVTSTLRESAGKSAPVASSTPSTAPSTAPGSAPTAGQAPASALPAAPQRLLAVQAALAGDARSRDRAAFETEMQEYRVRVLRALERAYPTRTGMLERGRR